MRDYRSMLTLTNFIIGFFLLLSGFLLGFDPATSDYPSFYIAGEIVKADQAHLLYDMNTQTDYQAPYRGFTPGDVNNLLIYVNPPHTAIFMLPLTWIPFTVSFFVWYAINLAMLAYFMRLVWNDLGATETANKWLIMSAIFGFHTIATVLYLGTFSILMLLATYQVYRSTQREQWFKAAFWLFIATFKFQFVLFIGLWMLIQRYWRGLFWFALICVGFVGISSLIWGWDMWPNYLASGSSTLNLFDQNGIKPSQTFTLRGTLALWFGAENKQLVNTASQIGLGLAALGFAGLIWRSAKHPQQQAWNYSLAVTFGGLFSLHMYGHDAMLYITPALLLFQLYQQRQQPSWLPKYCLLLPWLSLIGNSLFLDGELGIRLPTLVAISLVVVILRLRPQYQAVRLEPASTT
ncbi:glycosyltransferase family 87 protein [Herpetosiphon geysericola]|uniref:DUF2029 domain-containing protein n=1 Tax=Herpetosiphon geysericola TaxID=70996 RepID=A0A0P6Y0J2_9CHLR|nr:glycosyltransferase family 87 protein [Herpetosiphon geysericola]KPL90888.1 hypothetical protein SE18_03650 [Herpetosiphon geysericola]